jgi:hypothetical protein
MLRLMCISWGAPLGLWVHEWLLDFAFSVLPIAQMVRIREIQELQHAYFYGIEFIRNLNLYKRRARFD